jgi:O-antigen ligase
MAMNLEASGALPTVPAERGARGARAIEVARWAAIVGACSAMVSPPLANAGIAVMLIALLASGQAAPRLRQALMHPLTWGVALVVGVVALGMLWSEVSWAERLRASWTWRKLWIVPLLLALFGPALWKQRMIVAYVAVCTAAVLVSFGIVAVSGQLPTQVTDLAGSLLRNHSSQSMAFAVAAFLALWLALDGALRPAWRWAASAAAALFVLNMAFVTPGRSGYLALAVMLAVLVAARGRGVRQLALVAALGALFAVALALSPLARDRLGSALQEWRNVATAGVKTPMGIRANLYENTLEMVRERPWLGVGSGGFERAYSAQVKDKYTDWRVLPSADPHNQYLFFLAEQGLLGLLAFLAFIALALGDRGDRGDGGRMRVVGVAMLLAWCATSLLSSHFQTFAEGHLLAFFLAAMLARPVPGLDAVPRAAAAAPATTPQ